MKSKVLIVHENMREENEKLPQGIERTAIVDIEMQELTLKGNYVTMHSQRKKKYDQTLRTGEVYMVQNPLSNNLTRVEILGIDEKDCTIDLDGKPSVMSHLRTTKAIVLSKVPGCFINYPNEEQQEIQPGEVDNASDLSTHITDDPGHGKGVYYSTGDAKDIEGNATLDV